MLLPCSELAVGHCVIIDQCDKPSGKCVAVITKVIDGRVDAEYLCCESGKCFTSHPEVPTPVGLFGIQIVLKDSVYSCQVTGESGAQYRCGRERLWQEHVPYFYGIKKSLLKHFQ